MTGLPAWSRRAGGAEGRAAQPGVESAVVPHDGGRRRPTDGYRRRHEWRLSSGWLAAHVTSAPEFEEPPVVEMALGVQFRPLMGLRGIALGPLREQWRSSYPRVEEQAPLAPAIEGSQTPGIALQVGFGPRATARYWFLNAAGSELVQVQNDRLLVNWREGEPPNPYPRYPLMRALFEQRLGELRDFVERQQLGTIEVVQAELNYVNALPVEQGGQGRIDRFLRGWWGTADHHLGEPEQARVALTFSVPDVGRPPVRMYVAVDPAEGPEGQALLFFGLTVRGAPLHGMIGDSLEFMDRAHDHLVRSFTELTPEPMHEAWGRRG